MSQGILLARIIFIHGKKIKYKNFKARALQPLRIAANVQCHQSRWHQAPLHSQRPHQPVPVWSLVPMVVPPWMWLALPNRMAKFSCRQIFLIFFNFLSVFSSTWWKAVHWIRLAPKWTQRWIAILMANGPTMGAAQPVWSRKWIVYSLEVGKKWFCWVTKEIQWNL